MDVFLSRVSHILRAARAATQLERMPGMRPFSQLLRAAKHCQANQMPGKSPGIHYSRQTLEFHVKIVR